MKTEEREQMASTAWLVASIVPVVVGLVASAMLAVDYLRPRAVFCADDGGCAAVRQTALAAPLGIPMPIVGVVAFLAVGVVATLRSVRGRTAHLVLSAGVGLVGAMLLGVQLWLGHFCVYCAVVDVSALVTAAVAGARVGLAPVGSPSVFVSRGVSLGVLPLAAAVPLWVGFRASPVPHVIRDEIARTPAGKLTVVDFVDFECPFCRRTHAELEPLLLAHREQIRRVRVQVPLHSHAHALDAARAACCGEALGQGDRIADALFAAPVEELTRDGCERIAAQIGLDLQSFRDCVAAPATLARIERDRALFKAAGGHALPTLWVGDQELVGAQTEEVLARVLREALPRAGS